MSTIGDDFLADVDANEIPWVRPAGTPAALATDYVLIGAGADGLEVAVATASRVPKVDEVRTLWKLRWRRRASPVLLVVVFVDDSGNSQAHVCGTRDDPAVLTGLDLGNLERICAAALMSPDPVVGERTLHRLLAGQKDQLIAGLTNQGLFASHELRHGVPQRADWNSARIAGAKLLRSTGETLIRGLGFIPKPIGSTAHALTVGHARHGVAVLLNDNELFDRPSTRFGANSPVSEGLRIAKEFSLPWLIVVKGTQIRLYPAKPDIGVGRKGQSETFVELDLALLASEDAAFLPLLFGAEALTDRGSVAEILAASSDHATALGYRLRERVYARVVPMLAVAVGQQMNARTEQDLEEAYHRTLVILFRTLFVAYAEDRGLLPYQRNPRYTKKALKTLAREYADNPDLEFDAQATDIWDDLLAVWTAVDDGHSEWGVPPYNGGLFAADDAHPSGQAIARMELPNSAIGPALRALLIDESPDGVIGPVDFRAISVRAYGDVYEGLLESALSVAPSDLSLNKDYAFVPAREGDAVVVKKGSIYFHNASGARKASGSYYTRAFAVASLLDSSLEPALDEHLAKVRAHLDRGDDAAAADAFFDFRVIDLAMGSGHFLVAALDRIEDRFSTFIAEHPIAAVSDELSRLAEVAWSALGPNAGDIEIEPNALIRRQIARRCVYGLDLNLMAVELARLSLWIHTFVPGLPMSSLEHNFVVGNSLTGIGTLPEALAVFEPGSSDTGQFSLFNEQIEDTLSQARDALMRVARTTEATKAEVRNSAAARAKAMAAAADTKLLFDTAVGIRLGVAAVPTSPEDAITQAHDEAVRAGIDRLRPVHLPFVFPEVFLRDNPGFDVVVGNPPWEKVRWEAAQYWVGISPGLIALPDRARNAKIDALRQERPTEAAYEQSEMAKRAELQDYFRTSFTLRGGTHLEYAQLMLERALSVIRKGGRLGLVLPRQSMVLAGWKNLRHALVQGHSLRIVQGRNHSEWIFEAVHASYAVVLLTAGPDTGEPVRVWVATSESDVEAATDDTAIALTRGDLATYSETDVIPWFATRADRLVFDRMRSHYRLAKPGGWISGRHDARWDFRGSGPDRTLANSTQSEGAWSILMTAHVDAYTFDKTAQFKQFISDLPAMVRKDRGVVLLGGTYRLDETHPVILVRHPSRSDDTRTIIATAAPEEGIVHNKGYIHAIAHEPGTSENARLALLGLINTNTLDWWARRFVDRHVTAPVVNQLPIPEWDDSTVAYVADRVCVLLTRGGSTRLAGGIDVVARTALLDQLAAQPDEDLLADIEAAALRGYGLSADDFRVIGEDFSSKGLPPSHLSAVINRLTTPKE